MNVAKSVPCRKCGAEAGRVCRTSSGAAADIYHVIRRQEALGILPAQEEHRCADHKCKVCSRRRDDAERAEIKARIQHLNDEYKAKEAEADAVLLALGKAWLDMMALDSRVEMEETS